MRYSPDILGQISDSLDIVDVIDSHVSLKKQGKNYFACCPFHDESTPSFSVNADDQLFYCHGCGEGGNVFDFYTRFNNVSFPEAVRALAAQANIDLPKEELNAAQRKEIGDRARALDALSKANDFYRAQLPTNHEVLKLLSLRGLNRETVEKFNLGAAKNEWRSLIEAMGGIQNRSALVDSGLAVFEAKTDTSKGKFYDRFRNAPVFPIRDHKGKVVSFAIRPLQVDPEHKGSKYINGPETIVFKKSKVSYGLYEALQAENNPKNLLVVEGYMDVITSHQFGIQNTVGTMGTAINEERIKSLYRHTDHLIFCFDGDKAGYEASKRALNSVLPFLDDSHKASFLLLPAGEDPDSLIRKVDADAYKEFVATKQIPASEFLFQIARNGDSELTTAESRGQAFANAKVLMDQMPPSTTKAIMLSRLEQITGIKPTEYLPYSIQLSEGICMGVNIGDLENEVRDMIANRLGAKQSDIRVQWSMPEIGPRQIPFVPIINAGDAQKELGIRMKEVGRILNLDTQVAKGLSLAQVLNTAKTNTGESGLMARGLISRYLSDSDSFETECKMGLHHLEFIKNQLAVMKPALNETTKQQVSQWASNVGNKAFYISAANDYLDPVSAAKIERLAESMTATARKIEADIKLDVAIDENQKNVAIPSQNR